MKPLNLTASEVRRLFNYDPESGKLTRAVAGGRFGRYKPGHEAGTPGGKRHRQVRIEGRKVMVHRVIWLWMTGSEPEHVVDHINGDKTDNRWANLRDVPQAVNMQNQRQAHSNNKSTGLLGVSKAGRSYVAKVSVQGRQRIVCRSRDPMVAHQAYVAAKRQLHQGSTL